MASGKRGALGPRPKLAALTGTPWAVPAKMQLERLMWFGAPRVEVLGSDIRCGKTLTSSNRHFKGVQLWPRGIDSKKFSPSFRSQTLRKQLGIGKHILLLFVGRLVAEKDLADLVEATHKLRQKKYKFHLAFAGDGPYRSTLEKELPNDHYFGFIQDQRLADLYASSDLFVFPSTTETFGNVILEAFASGLPVIGVKKGGSVDLIHHGFNGFLAEPHNSKNFADQIQTLLDDPKKMKKMSKKALETASRYNWPAINDRLITYYDWLIKNKKLNVPPPTIDHFYQNHPNKNPLSASSHTKGFAR